MPLIDVNKNYSVNKYYVYIHFHPKTKEVVYVGKGTGHRAWVTSCNPAAYKQKYGQGRTPEHHSWAEALFAEGYTPEDFVKIKEKGLNNKAALQYEAELKATYIKAGSKLFNMNVGEKLLKLSIQQTKEAEKLRLDDKSYLEIAAHFGVSTMAVWNLLNGKRKSHNERVANAN